MVSSSFHHTARFSLLELQQQIQVAGMWSYFGVQQYTSIRLGGFMLLGGLNGAGWLSSLPEATIVFRDAGNKVSGGGYKWILCLWCVLPLVFWLSNAGEIQRGWEMGSFVYKVVSSVPPAGKPYMIITQIDQG